MARQVVDREGTTVGFRCSFRGCGEVATCYHEDADRFSCNDPAHVFAAKQAAPQEDRPAS